MQAINDFILAAAGQPWVLLLVLACCVIDGFFPPIPSESVVVGLAAVAATADVPNPWLLMLVAAPGGVHGGQHRLPDRPQGGHPALALDARARACRARSGGPARNCGSGRRR